MSTPAHQSHSVAVPMNGDNLDTLIEDIMTGFQTSPTVTESPVSPPRRMFFFFPC